MSDTLESIRDRCMSNLNMADLLVPAKHFSDGRKILINKNNVAWVETEGVVGLVIHMNNGDFFYGWEY